ncbi:hypothetical protein PIB30_040200 [Stylosanthes scabra]|uniref:Uncharacterized protein n=1 Tax=Stylosanthes scabra TaxID=79078 RepID=A0ABU6QF23_9FABA|nr:hypothetical protein [Stylosanthes scabra]
MSLGLRGVKRTRCSAYGNSGPSGVVSGRGGHRACPSQTPIDYDYEIDDVKDRLRLGPDDWYSGKYERWLSGASSGSVGLGYDNRPGELILAYRNRHASSAFDCVAWVRTWSFVLTPYNFSGRYRYLVSVRGQMLKPLIGALLVWSRSVVSLA